MMILVSCKILQIASLFSLCIIFIKIFLTVTGCIPARYQLALNAFFVMTMIGSMRQNVSVAMVAMANNTVIARGPSMNGSLGDLEICPAGVGKGNSTVYTPEVISSFCLSNISHYFISFYAER